MKREIWHLTEGLVFMHFAFFLMTQTGQVSANLMALIPGTLAVRPWTPFTFQFIHGGMISFFFSALVLWIMARPLEELWGSPRFLAFYLISISGAVGTALLLGAPLAGDIFLATSLLFTFATLYPDTEFLLFFIVPVKVKYLAIVGGAFLAFSSFGYGLMAGAANIVGMSAGYVFFLATRRMPTRRKIAFEMKKRRAVREISAENSAIETKNRQWDPRVLQAETETKAAGEVPGGLLPLLEELDAAVDSTVTVCAPEDFGHIDDPICRTCAGYPECAARAIRAAAKD